MRARSKQAILVLFDVLIINLSIILSFWLRFEWTIPPAYVKLFPDVFILSTLLRVAIYWYFGLYSSLWKYASIDELLRIIVATTVGSAAVISAQFMLGIHLPRSIYVIIWLLNTLLVGGSRLSYRVIRRVFPGFRSDGEPKKVLVVGAGDAGSMVIKELKSHPELGLWPVAIADDDPRKQKSQVHYVPVLGTRSDIPQIVEAKKIDEIIIAIPSAPKSVIRETIEIAKHTRCKLKILPGVYELIDGKVSVKHIRDVQIEDLLGREPVKVDLQEIAGYLQDQVVLVTGGGGSIGSELCRQIARFNPKQLLILDIYENGAYDLQMELKRKHPDLPIKVLIASVRDRRRMESIFAAYRPDVVFHAAAHKHVPLMEENPEEAVKNNIFGTLNVAECADKFGTKRFVLISTDKAVNPTNIMGATKRVAELIIQTMNAASDTEFVAVRFGNVLGSNGSVIPLFKKQIAEGGPVTVTHPEINRFFMTIPEAVQLVIQAGAMARGGEIFILDMGEPVKIVDLAKDLIRLSGLEPGVDIEIQFTGLRPGEKLYEEVLMAEEGLQATKHEKIFISKPLPIDETKLREDLKRLFNLISSSPSQIRFLIKELVPTYQIDKDEEIAG